MTDKIYKLVFEGKIEAGRDISDVKRGVAKLLKIDAKKVAHLFSGKPVVIKKTSDKATAVKYRQKLSGIGAMSVIIPPAGISPPLKPPAAPAPAPEKKSAEPAPKPDLNADIAELKPASADEMMACPACNYRQKKADKCMMCGVVISDFLDGRHPTTLARRPLTRLGDDILLTNIEYVPGCRIVEHFGLVSGSTIRAKHIGRDLMASLKNIVGGELKGYTELLQESREEAIDRMKAQARQVGANAVVNVRLATSSLTQGAAELYAYGTAVKVE